MDIIERKRSKEALQRNEEQLQAILDHSMAVIYLKDIQGRFLLVNRRFETVHHVTREQVLGKTGYDLFPQEIADALRENDQKVLEAGAPLEFEEIAPHDDGLHTFISVKFPLCNAAGVPYAVGGISTDITERKRMEEALRETNELTQAHARRQGAIAKIGHRALAGIDLSTLMDETVALVAQILGVELCSVWELLPDGNTLLLRAGRGWKEGCVGYATVTTDSQTCCTLFSDSPMSCEDLSAETRFSNPPLLRDHGVVSGMSVSIHGPARPFGVLSACTTRQRTFTQDDLHFLQSVSNVLATAIERKRSEEELKRTKKAAERANRAKSQFLANMSHELRTPLNAILGFSEILQDQSFGELNERQARYIGNILNSGRHLLQLINDILDLSRVESGCVEIECVSFNVVEALQEAVAVIKTLAARKNMALAIDVKPGLSIIVADHSIFKQILYNLLSNAIKFTPMGGSVKVIAEVVRKRPGDEPICRQIVRPVNQFMKISVSDTGIGINTADQQRIFNEFEQVDSSYTRKYQGTGLGLALTRRLVELHGGRIWVESEGEGKGSTFTFLIPMEAASVNP